MAKGIDWLLGFLNGLGRAFGMQPEPLPPRQPPGGGRPTTEPPPGPPPGIESDQHPFQVLARKFIELTRADVVEAFASSSDPVTGTAWAARKDKLPHPLLIKTGYMLTRAMETLDAAKPQVRSGDAGSIVEVIADMNGDPPYAIFHQWGTYKMPMRRFFCYSPKTVDDLTKSVTEAATKMTLTNTGRPW